MDDELCTAMLTAAFAAVVILLGLLFIDQRRQEEAAFLLRSVAISQARAAPNDSRPGVLPGHAHGVPHRELAHSHH